MIINVKFDVPYVNNIKFCKHLFHNFSPHLYLPDVLYTYRKLFNSKLIFF